MHLAAPARGGFAGASGLWLAALAGLRICVPRLPSACCGALGCSLRDLCGEAHLAVPGQGHSLSPLASTCSPPSIAHPPITHLSPHLLGGPAARLRLGTIPGLLLACCSVSLNKMPNVGNAPFLSSCNMKALTAFTLGIFCENEGVQSHNMLAQCLLTVIV